MTKTYALVLIALPKLRPAETDVTCTTCRTTEHAVTESSHTPRTSKQYNIYLRYHLKWSSQSSKQALTYADRHSNNPLQCLAFLDATISLDISLYVSFGFVGIFNTSVRVYYLRLTSSKLPHTFTLFYHTQPVLRRASEPDPVFIRPYIARKMHFGTCTTRHRHWKSQTPHCRPSCS